MASLASITLHWLDRSRAQRIIWLLEELNLQYRLVTYKRLPDQQAPASLKAVHPLGKSPVLEIKYPKWNKPLVLAESANIIEYVAEHFGRNLIPDRYKDETKTEDPESGPREETEEWLRYRYYMNYAEGSLMNLVGTGALKNGELISAYTQYQKVKTGIIAIKNAPVPFFIKPLTGRIAGQLEKEYLNHNYESHFSFLESELASYQPKPPPSEPSPYFFCGLKLSAADFMMAFPLEAAQQIAGLTEAKYPLLTDYVRRVQGREAYKRAIERIIKETGSYEAGI
jgi:glutathione S-transferase